MIHLYRILHIKYRSPFTIILPYLGFQMFSLSILCKYGIVEFIYVEVLQKFTKYFSFSLSLCDLPGLRGKSILWMGCSRHFWANLSHLSCIISVKVFMSHISREFSELTYCSPSITLRNDFWTLSCSCVNLECQTTAQYSKRLLTKSTYTSKRSFLETPTYLNLVSILILEYAFLLSSRVFFSHFRSLVSQTPTTLLSLTLSIVVHLLLQNQKLFL